MSQNRVTAYIAFGANLSNPRATFLDVIERLALRGIEVKAASALWKSPAWPPGTNSPDYINAVIRIETNLRPRTLMELLLEIETDLGRTRSVKNAPRTCDLDLIDYAGQISTDAHCILPHPRMQDRDFVLLPMKDVADEGWRHPKTGENLSEMLSQLS